MAAAKDDRRSQELKDLDIDRRKSDVRRDDKRRPWLSKAYEEIYISSYVNSIYPRFPSKVHALSNLEGDSELSAAEWAVANLAVNDAEKSLALRNLRTFAAELIQKGLVVDEAGKPVMTDASGKAEGLDHWLLKTGS